MLALRFAAVLALAIWIGGLAVLGALVAPAAFEMLGAGGNDGRLQAGALVGRMLMRFQAAAYVCGGVVMASLAIRAVLGPRPRRFAIRLLLAAVITVAALYSGQILMPRIEQARASGPLASTLPPDDPRRVAFGRMHGLSTSLQLIPVIGGMVLLIFELRD